MLIGLAALINMVQGIKKGPACWFEFSKLCMLQTAPIISTGTQMKPVVLAGGSGSRLWPKSRAALPKQFLALTSDKTMLQDTLARLDGTEAAQ